MFGSWAHSGSAPESAYASVQARAPRLVPNYTAQIRMCICKSIRYALVKLHEGIPSRAQVIRARRHALQMRTWRPDVMFAFAMSWSLNRFAYKTYQQKAERQGILMMCLKSSCVKSVLVWELFSAK